LEEDAQWVVEAGMMGYKIEHRDSRVPAFREERGAGGRRDDSLRVGR
jgi:hypothetical protein